MSNILSPSPLPPLSLVFHADSSSTTNSVIQPVDVAVTVSAAPTRRTFTVHSRDKDASCGDVEIAKIISDGALAGSITVAKSNRTDANTKNCDGPRGRGRAGGAGVDGGEGEGSNGGAGGRGGERTHASATAKTELVCGVLQAQLGMFLFSLGLNFGFSALGDQVLVLS